MGLVRDLNEIENGCCGLCQENFDTGYRFSVYIGQPFDSLEIKTEICDDCAEYLLRFLL